MRHAQVRHAAGSDCGRDARRLDAGKTALIAEELGPWVGWPPMIVFSAAAVALRGRLASWQLMWLLAYAIFLGCKWQTWWEAFRRNGSAGPSRTIAYLLAWPGMDAEAFLRLEPRKSPPPPSAWIEPSLKTLAGGVFVWLFVRKVPAGHDLIAGWVGLAGLVLVLHFGLFHLIALFWQGRGVDAQPIMQAPLASNSLSDFWGRRWNLGFRRLTHGLVFEPARKAAGLPAATVLAFFVSGIVHDLVISLPARAGYGLPTCYFLFQGFGVLIERSAVGRRWKLGEGMRGRAFAVAWAGFPVFWLFHPAFVLRVAVPFLRAMGAF